MPLVPLLNVLNGAQLIVLTFRSNYLFVISFVRGCVLCLFAQKLNKPIGCDYQLAGQSWNGEMSRGELSVVRNVWRIVQIANV